MRTLIVAPNWIGDAVMAQPLLALIKAREPTRPLDWLAAPHILPVGAAIPEIDRLIEAPNGMVNFNSVPVGSLPASSREPAMTRPTSCRIRQNQP